VDPAGYAKPEELDPDPAIKERPSSSLLWAAGAHLTHEQFSVSKALSRHPSGRHSGIWIFTRLRWRDPVAGFEKVAAVLGLQFQGSSSLSR
jgi:hypothetical protein